MSAPIRITSRAIHCRADVLDAVEWEVRRGAQTFLVTAHCRADAEDAVDYYRPEPDSADTLLPGISGE